MKAYKGRLEGTTISVDNFRASKTITHYFLTHGHSDHCTGLTPTWNCNVIYTTSITKKFIIKKYRMDPSIFIELHVGIRRIIPLVYRQGLTENNNINNNNNNTNNNIAPLSFAVTPIPANHCPGAVCYLFEGYFGRFLCTGDFRYKQGLFNGYNVFNVDRLYLDDTYCNPYYNHFLTDIECANEMVKIINLPENKNCKVMIAVDTLGKENIFIQLSKKLNTFIVVNPERYKRLKLLLEDENDSNSINTSRYFTTQPNDGYIFMVNKREASLSNLDRLNEKIFKYSQTTQQTLSQSELHQFIAILPSGWSINKNPLKISTYGSRMYTITYSAHSSYEELCNAVRLIQPRHIIPIVDDRLSRAPKCFKDYMSLEKPKLFIIPPIIKDIINGNRNMAKICVQHLSSYNGNIVQRRVGKRKKISSLLLNRVNRNNRRAKFKNINKAKLLSSHSKKKIRNKLIEQTQIENDNDIVFINEKKQNNINEIIDLLTPPLDDKIENKMDCVTFMNDISMPSLSISHLMENDSNFIGDDILTQNVDLVVTMDNNIHDDISVHSDPFSYFSSNNNNGKIRKTFLKKCGNPRNVSEIEDRVSLSCSPAKKKRKLSKTASVEIISDDDECVFISQRKRRHKHMIVESQWMDDGYEQDIENEWNDIDNDTYDNINVNENIMSAKKVQKAKSVLKKRKKRKLVHIMDIEPKLKIYDFNINGRKRKFDDMNDEYLDDNNWENGVDFVATFSGTEGEISDFEDEDLLNTVCEQTQDILDEINLIINDNKECESNNGSDESDKSQVFTTQRSRKGNEISRKSNENVDIIDLT